ncbi:MAG: SLBB domain-containing protein, partial [bacterium]|nr:SLBB domain-containing protein [bacterium]
LDAYSKHPQKDNSFKTKQADGTGTAGKTSGGGEGFVSTMTYQIHILGEIEHPGTYRLTPSTRLDESIGMAGGVKSKGSLRHVEIRRGTKTLLYDLLKFRKEGDLNQNPFLMDNDVVFIPFIEKAVAIHGPVKSDGIYELTDAEKTIWDLIQFAGGFTIGMTDNDPVVVIRFVDGKKELIKISNQQSELEAFGLVNGDIVVIPHMLVENRRFDYRMVELPHDNVFYPTQQNEVYVTGAVASPGAYPFNPTYTMRDFVNTAGPVELSNLHNVHVLTADGKYLKNPEKTKGFHLSPGDSIIVPKRAWTTDNVLKWYNTLTGTIFTSFALKELLKK